LVGIESDNLLISLLKPENFSLIFAFFGVLLIMCSKKTKQKDIGNMLVGFAILMYGMKLMSSAMKPLAELPAFTQLLTAFQNPILGVLAGLIITAIIQSSSASVGILQAMALTKAVSVGAAIPIIMGQNIGTCVTAVLSGIGASKNAKRTALIHLYFNLIGTALFMTAFYLLHGLLDFEFLTMPAGAAGIAMVHSVFNITATAVLLPFSGMLVKLACLTIPESAEDPEKEQEEKLKILDVRFLETPGYAAEQARDAAVRMARISGQALARAVGLLDDYQEEELEKVLALEDRTDRYEDELGSYLVKLGSRDLSEKESYLVSTLLHCIGDFERISDHAVNVAQTARELHQKGTEFSRKAKEELRVFSDALLEIVKMAVDAFAEEDCEKATRIEPLEETIDRLNRKLKKRHVERLRTGECTIELGFALSDLTTDYERVSDHCSNIAIALLQSGTDGYEAHEYAAELRREDNPGFRKACEEYREKYVLPDFGPAGKKQRDT